MRNLILFSIEAPLGYHNALSATQSDYMADRTKGRLVTEQQAEAHKWEEITSLKPSESNFTLMVPIHNERVTLSSMLAALDNSLLPRDLNLKVVFVTNGCTDDGRSTQIVSDYMRLQNGATITGNQNDGYQLEGGELDYLEIDTSAHKYDPNLSHSVKHAKKGSIHYFHFDTATAGKANAQNVVNKWCLDNGQGEELLMSMDANNYPEPEAIARLFKETTDLVRNDPKFGIISATACEDIQKKSKLFKFAKSKVAGVGNKTEVSVNGWLHAWIPKQIEEVGGVPRIAGVDYAIGALLRLAGRSIYRSSEVRIHGFEPSDWKYRVEQYRRAARARRQLIDYEPQLATMVKEDNHYMRPFPQRLIELKEWIKTNPTGVPFVLSKWLMWELGIILGNRDYEKNPFNATWTPIASTKS